MYERFAMLVVLLGLLAAFGTNAEDLSEFEKAMMTTGGLRKHRTMLMAH
jgi:hypothetical protein